MRMMAAVVVDVDSNRRCRPERVLNILYNATATI